MQVAKAGNISSRKPDILVKSGGTNERIIRRKFLAFLVPSSQVRILPSTPHF